jgi:LytS/YehU family sensor histidine kinase
LRTVIPFPNMNHLKIIIVSIFILLTGLQEGVSQPSKLDSLLQVVSKEKDPKIKCDKYIAYIAGISSLNRDSAITLLTQAAIDYQKTGFKFGVGRAISQKAWYVLFNSKYEESLKLGHQALAIQKTIQDTAGIGITLNGIAVANMQFKRFKDAERYYLQALKYFEVLKDTSKMDMVINNLGVLAFELKSYPTAIKYYRQSLQIRQSKKKLKWVAYSNYNIGATYLNMNQLDSAEYYLLLGNKIFIDNSKSKNAPAMVTIGIAQLYQKKKDYKEALKFAEKGVADAIKADHTEMILEGKGILADVLFNLNRHKEAYEIQAEYLELKKSVDSTNNASTVAEIEERYKNAEKEVEITKLKSQKLEAENKAQSFKIYALAVSIAVLLLSAIVILLWQRRNQKEKIKLSNLNTKIAEAKMFALRAQMNPHFIFNCINTAQSFVMQNQREQANEYLANFAKLLRLVMENSAKTFVQLEDEISQLKLYLELESIRFENKFIYNIQVDQQLLEGIYEIPGMCIQPLIENAIGHGLINRNDTQGVLNIHLKLENECVVCEVTDNGVGRDKAATIKAAKNIRYQSTALPNINQRLEMLKAETNQEVLLKLSDLIENGQIAGTKAVLTLPWK